MFALLDLQQSAHRKRDFFPAQIAAIQMNKMRTEDQQRVWDAEDILAAYYPTDKKRIAAGTDVIITQEHDPDRGALGDWQGLREGLRRRKNGR